MYEIRQTQEFLEWLDSLEDGCARVRIAARLRRLESGNLGDWAPVRGAVSELRVAVGAGYRLYFTRRGRVFIILLNGGDKSSQRRDIRIALKMVDEIGEIL